MLSHHLRTLYEFPFIHTFFQLIFFGLSTTLYIFKYILLVMLLQLSFLPFIPFHPAPLLPPAFLPLCPWVIHISSLASTFPMLFLPSPCPISTYHLCYLFSVPFLPLSPSHSPVDNPPCDLPSLWFCSCSSCLLTLLLFWF